MSGIERLVSWMNDTADELEDKADAAYNPESSRDFAGIVREAANNLGDLKEHHAPYAALEALGNQKDIDQKVWIRKATADPLDEFGDSTAFLKFLVRIGNDILEQKVK